MKKIKQEKWADQFDMQFGTFGSFWEKWANGNFPEQGGISDDLKSFFRDVLEKEIHNERKRFVNEVLPDVLQAFISDPKDSLPYKAAFNVIIRTVRENLGLKFM